MTGYAPPWACRRYGDWEHDWLDCVECQQEYERFLDMENKGVLITLEGIDGSGKTTQAKLLARCLEMSATFSSSSVYGKRVVSTREPTDGWWGHQIRQSAGGNAKEMTPREQVDAFTKDRMEHIRKVIHPALGRGDIVICDRYIHSTIAYQGARDGMDAIELSREMFEFPCPDAVLLFDCDPSLAMTRIIESRGAQPDCFEKEEYLEKVRDIYMLIAAADRRVHVIDARCSRESILKMSMDILDQTVFCKLQGK